MSDQEETIPKPPAFDFTAFPVDTVFYDRREGIDRRERPAIEAPPLPEKAAGPKPERRAKKERRRRIDPTTFEKQYTDDELEFMNAMQRFKVQTGTAFPSHGDVLRIAFSLGYRRDEPTEADLETNGAPDPSVELSSMF